MLGGAGSWDFNLLPPLAGSGYGQSCPATVPPLPDHYGPPSVPSPDPTLSNPTTSTVSGTTCAIFLPGHYTARPNLVNGNNYFTSGFYYFDFDGAFNVTSSMSVWGGKPATSEVPS